MKEPKKYKCPKCKGSRFKTIKKGLTYQCQICGHLKENKKVSGR